MLWCHGTPGAQRQFPLVGRRAATQLGLRVVVVERPRSGLSDAHAYAAMADWAADMAHVADALDAERLGVVGLPVATPTLWPAARRPRWPIGWPPWRCWAARSVGRSDAVTGTIADVARRYASIVSELRRPLAAMATGLLSPLVPFGHYAMRAYSSLSPEGDRVVFADPEIEGMFIDDPVG
ncbi:hypothetical protein A9W97_18725 [Mycobacterium gordonae]|nr:hypothetical protein [Mycobacterium gordonae]OBJ86046.1 hypothetical protein A9W97_18725 [Mycobacterium gordonae]